MKNTLRTSGTDIGLLLVRVALGAVFIVHGLDKISHIEGVVGFFSSLHVSGFLAYVVAYAELLGGIAILLGVLANWTGVALAVIMAFAIVLAKMSKGFLGGFEFELTLFLAALAIAFAGAGRYSLSRLWNKE